jgi:UDP-sugar pyrophosphorylase
MLECWLLLLLIFVVFDIQIELPTELTTGKCYLQYYIEYILSLQHRFAKGSCTILPLCIMTSKDTHEGTIQLLTKHDYFGMKPSQVTLVQQGDGVPALQDNAAKFVLDPSNPYRILTKPHGHGDIHALLYNKGVAKEWVRNGIRWITLFQVRCCSVVVLCNTIKLHYLDSHVPLLSCIAV